MLLALTLALLTAAEPCQYSDAPTVTTPTVRTPTVRTPEAETPTVRTPEVRSPTVRTPQPTVSTPTVRTPQPGVATPTVRTPQPSVAGGREGGIDLGVRPQGQPADLDRNDVLRLQRKPGT